MSTEFYALKEPFTSLRLIRYPEYQKSLTEVMVFIGIRYAGSLYFTPDELPPGILMFADISAPRFFRFNNIVTKCGNPGSDPTQVISEYGELIDVADLWHEQTN